MQAVIFVGIPGSGKSTFYQQRFFDTHVRINLDMLKTRHRERALIAACIAAKQRFVVDNTNVTRADRTTYIEQAQAAGFQVVGYYFETKLGDALERNRARARAVPDKGVVARYYRLQVPSLDEGFDELYVVRLDGTGAFELSEVKEKTGTRTSAENAD